MIKTVKPPRNRPAQPIPSATAILIRETDTNPEVYLLRRSKGSSAFPGNYVFPGGVLEADDYDTAFWLDHTDLGPEALARALNGPVDEMLPVAVAAVRETFEEAGLLLARKGDGPADTESFSRYGISFNRLIADHGLRLAVSRLGRWCRWISPERMRKRFDTYFFVVSVPANAACGPDNDETVHGVWLEPLKALLRNHEGQLPLSPPTLATLHQLAHYSDRNHIMAEAYRRPWPEPFVPRMWPLGKSVLIIEPWDPDYHSETVQVAPERLHEAVLPPGAPFSRLWLKDGRCRPVRHPSAE